MIEEIPPGIGLPTAFVASAGLYMLLSQRLSPEKSGVITGGVNLLAVSILLALKPHPGEQFNGRTLKWVPADGACLFHACANQVKGWDAAKLRAAVVEKHRKNPDLKNFITDQTLEQYCTHMSKPKSWGDEQELIVIPDLLKRNIKVYKQGSPLCETYEAKAPEAPTIEILLKGNHYWIVQE